jgi:hemerythrin superfamily protein
MTTTTPMMLLKKDHQKVKAMLTELSETTERAVVKRTELRQQIFQEITIHTMLEEEIFYPALHNAAKKRDDEKLFFEATEEHRAAKSVLADLMQSDPATLTFAGRAKVLKELIFHHAKEEESDMFPVAQKLIPAEEHKALADQMIERKAALVAQFPRVSAGHADGRPAARA